MYDLDKTQKYIVINTIPIRLKIHIDMQEALNKDGIRPDREIIYIDNHTEIIPGTELKFLRKETKIFLNRDNENKIFNHEDYEERVYYIFTLYNNSSKIEYAIFEQTLQQVIDF